MLAEVAALTARPIDAMSIEQLNSLRIAELEPIVGRATAHLRARDALYADARVIREEMAALSERIAQIIERVRVIEVEQMLAEMAALVAKSLRLPVIDDLVRFCEDELEPMVTRAAAYLKDRNAYVDQSDGSDGSA